MSTDPTVDSLRRWLAQTEEAWREEHFARLTSVELFGGRLSAEAFRPFDRRRAQRAGAAFGLKGGELCGCHVHGCEACASNGGCGDEACGSCAGSLREYRAVLRELREEQEGGGSSAGNIDEGPGQGSSLDPVPAMAPSATYVDAHCHLMGPTADEWTAWRDSSTIPSSLDDRIEATVDGLQAQGVATVVLSVQSQAEGNDEYINRRELDDVCKYAAGRHPGFFVPLARGVDPGSAWAPFYFKAALYSGFEGIGELLIHDASGEATKMYEEMGLGSLYESFRVVANAQKIVMVHWNIASVDPTWSLVSPRESFNQFKWLLDKFPQKHPSEADGTEDPMPLKLILAHCGAGPDANRSADRAADFAAFLTTYEKWLDILLADYPNLYFDLAGMQVNGIVESLYDSTTPPPELLTPLGDLLIRRISGFPTRFLVGTDTLSKTTTDIATWAASYANYATFLALQAADGTTISASDQQLVLSTNWSTILADVYP